MQNVGSFAKYSKKKLMHCALTPVKGQGGDKAFIYWWLIKNKQNGRPDTQNRPLPIDRTVYSTVYSRIQTCIHPTLPYNIHMQGEEYKQHYIVH